MGRGSPSGFPIRWGGGAVRDGGDKNGGGRTHARRTCLTLLHVPFFIGQLCPNLLANHLTNVETCYS
jgi:hypothetical protein